MFVCFHKAPIWIDDKIQASHLELNHACSAQNVNKKISPLKKLFAYVEKFNNGDPQERVFIFITWYKGEPAWTQALEGPHIHCAIR